MTEPVKSAPMVQAILVAIVAGITTALLSGILTPGSMSLALFSLVAPAPLFIAGFGWHPLVALLGGIVAALSAQAVTSNIGALMVAFMLAVPAYGITALSERFFCQYSGRPERDGLDLGRIAMFVLFYVAFGAVAASLYVEPDYGQLVVRIRKAVEMAFVAMGLDRSLSSPDELVIGKLLNAMTALLLPMSALISLATITISATLGVMVADRSERLVFARPDFRRFRLPGGSLILGGVAMLIALRPGYLGLFGEIVVLGLMFFYMLQGFAVLHARTINVAGRGFLIAGAWALVILFSVPAVIFVSIGLADHLMDFRRGRL